MGAAVGVGWAASPVRLSDASTRDVAVCMGTTVLSFNTHNLTAAGIPDAFTFASSGGSCTGLVSGPASWSGSGTLQVAASCTEIVVTGATGTITGPNQNGPVDIDVAGPSLAQAWIFVGSNTGQVDAVGGFAWLDTDEINNCLSSSGTATMTLTSALALATT
jgi:hypothetical protein